MCETGLPMTATCICESLCRRAAAVQMIALTNSCGAVLVRCAREDCCASRSPCRSGVAVLIWVDDNVQVLSAVQENRCWDMLLLQMRAELQNGCRSVAVQVDIAV